MKDFKEYLAEKEDSKEEALNEDFGLSALAVLGISGGVGVLGAFGGAQLLFAISRGTKGLIRNWKIAIKEFKSIKDVSDTDYSKFVNHVKADPLVKKVYADEQANMREYNDVLKDVYKAIDAKQYSKGKTGVADAFKVIPRNLQNSPDVKRAIINAIIRSTGEPPIWPPSPGNVTYQAIKYSIGIREAKAQAEAFKYASMRAMEKVNKEEDERTNS